MFVSPVIKMQCHETEMAAHLGRFDKCISVLQSGNEVLMLSLSCFSFPVFYLGEFFNSDFFI